MSGQGSAFIAGDPQPLTRDTRAEVTLPRGWGQMSLVKENYGALKGEKTCPAKSLHTTLSLNIGAE